MKLKSVSVIFVLCVVQSLVETVNSFCLVRNTLKPKVYSYHCFKSINYLSDVKSAPIDIPAIIFSYAKIQFLRDRSFVRLRRGLESLEINLSEIVRIDDDAFDGLVNLKSFGIVDSNLKVVKGAWFKGLPNLKTISFRGNDIKRIEDSFFSIVPPLDALDVTANDLTCLPMNELATFKTKLVKFRFNPLSWGCVFTLWQWVEKTNTKYDDFGRGHWDPSSEIVLDCEEELKQHRREINEVNVKNCAEKMVTDLIPHQENYTVNELCKFLNNKSSPYLTCT